jgi:hypothetical protein
VEPAVDEVVLDSGSACLCDLTVDDVELAVVGSAELVLPPVEALAVRIEPVLVEREDVVDDDLRAGGRKPSNIARASL